MKYRLEQTIIGYPIHPPILNSWKNIYSLVLATLVVLLLIFAVLRPAFRGLVGREIQDQKALAENGPIKYDENGVPIATPAEGGEETNIQGLETQDLLLLDAPQSYEKRLEYVQKLVDEEPKLVAQVVKSWVTENG